MNFKKLSRRNFFKTTTLSVGGLMTTRLVRAGAGKQTHRKGNIVYRTLGNTGIQVPVISCGSVKKDNASLIKAAVEAGKFLDKERQKPVNDKAAIKYVLNNPYINTLLLSIKSYDKLNEFMAIMDNLELTNEELNELESYTLQGSLYCLGCEEGLGQCRKNLPIPDLMRAYMYTYGYNEISEGYKLVQSLNVHSNPCDDCMDCTVQCQNGFNVARKVKDIIRLKQVPAEFIV